MYTRTNYRPQHSRNLLSKSRSSDNFYLRASQRTIKYPIQPQIDRNDCLACKHEIMMSSNNKLTSHKTMMGKYQQTHTSEYYKVEDSQLTHLRKSKRYLQQMLDKNKQDFRKTIQKYQSQLQETNIQLQNKNQALLELQKSYYQLQAQQQYQNAVSNVRSYKQLPVEGDEQIKTKKIKQLLRKNQKLEQQLVRFQQEIIEQRQKNGQIQKKITKMENYQFYAQEYEAMRGLITKMEKEKLQLLDRQQKKIAQIQQKYLEQIAKQEQKVADLKRSIDLKNKAIQSLDNQMQDIKTEFIIFKRQQFDSLKQLIDQKQKECLALQSKILCIQSQLNFLKGRFGYILKLAKFQQIGAEVEQEQYCIERVGRYNVSGIGRESMTSMNLSPIRKK